MVHDDGRRDVGRDVGREQVREEVRAWLRDHWDPDLALHEWRGRLVDSGWAVPSWPDDCLGRGLPPAADDVVAEELAAAGAVGMPFGVGFGLVAPTLLSHGSPELRARLLRPILTGEHTWCQLFSEPGNGSDLAGLTTHARRDGNDRGDEWIVNGQKLWSTSAHHADFGLLLARTDWDVPKHRGITCFALPMRQPGVLVRPLRQMNGHASFNEIFLTDARVAGANVIGEPNEGWTVALTTLAHERRFQTVAPPGRDDRRGRAVREARDEADEYLSTYRWYPQRAGRADLVADVARENGCDGDPLIRQEIAALFALHRAHQWTMQRAHAARLRGRAPGPEGSLGKLAASVVARAAASVHARVAGAAALVNGPESLRDGVVAEVLVSVPAQSIAGGTDEIQRNIIGERVLGLPKEPSVDRDMPFRLVPRN
jgi:alkylation response protein AidB-like acyl-CoA dehydrogenase